MYLQVISPIVPVLNRIKFLAASCSVWKGLIGLVALELDFLGVRLASSHTSDGFLGLILESSSQRRIEELLECGLALGSSLAVKVVATATHRYDVESNGHEIGLAERLLVRFMAELFHRPHASRPST